MSSVCVQLNKHTDLNLVPVFVKYEKILVAQQLCTPCILTITITNFTYYLITTWFHALCTEQTVKFVY